MRKTSDFKLTLLGIVPQFTDETGSLDPQSISALSALMTFKGKSIQQLKEDALAKDKPFDEQIYRILLNSSLKGHASIATTPVLSFTYEASKFIDSALTGLPFASALMHSGRRADITPDDTVLPSSIGADRDMEALYVSESEKLIVFFNELLASGLPKDYASKILPYGNYGTGTITLSLESLLAVKREYQIEKDWMPEEVGLLLREIETKLKEMGVDLAYFTRFVSPASMYPYPNIFKNPTPTNLAREYKKSVGDGHTKVVTYTIENNEALKQALHTVDLKLREIAGSKERLAEEWFEVLLERQRIIRDFNSAVSLQILSTVSWRVWGDKKRHRTVPMVVDSMYHAIARACEVFFRHQTEIQSGTISTETIESLDSVFAIPERIRTQEELVVKWVQHASSALRCYSELTKHGVKPSDAIFIIPRGIRIDVLQEYNMHNLISGYFPLRLCTTAEEQLQKLSLREAAEIKKILTENNLPELASLIRPKCQTLGFCPEKKNCAVITQFNPDYTEEWHSYIHSQLEEKFKHELDSLNV